MKKYLLIFKNSPFADYSSLEGIEFALALSAFEQEVNLLFTGAGVLQLLPNKDAGKIAKKDYTNVLSGLELFDLKNIYAEQNALQTYKLNPENLICKVRSVSDTEIAELTKQYDIILTV